MLADCHTHLDQFDEAETPEIVGRAEEAGVGLIIIAGTTLESSRRCIALAEAHAALYAGVGAHPTDLSAPFDDETYAGFRDMALSSRKVVVVSEIGLDYLKTSPDRKMQDAAFRQQLRLALELGLPVVFHSRESHEDVLRVLREERVWDVGGIFHYFQGGEATARQAIDMGLYVSLARPLLRLPELQDAARAIPLGAIVLESDSFPQPFKKYRHNWTEPRHVAEVAEKLAELKGLEVAEVAEATTANLRAVTKGRMG